MGNEEEGTNFASLHVTSIIVNCRLYLLTFGQLVIMQENKAYERFRFHGLMYADELRTIFKDVLASGDHVYVPSATQDDLNDVYRPQMDDQREGSGDSEEEDFGAVPAPSLGVTNDMEDMNVHTNTTASASASRGKRKMGESSGRKKRSKMSTAQLVADAISRIANVSEGRAEAFDREQSREPPRLTEVISELKQIEAVSCDRDFRRRCCNMMMYPICRDMYVALRDDEEALLEWLRDHAYNAPHL